jgi:hypothetical protein
MLKIKKNANLKINYEIFKRMDNYFVYNELEEIEEGTNRTFKKANLNIPKIKAAIKNLDNLKITKNGFKEFITKGTYILLG